MICFASQKHFVFVHFLITSLLLFQNSSTINSTVCKYIVSVLEKCPRIEQENARLRLQARVSVSGGDVGEGAGGGERLTESGSQSLLPTVNTLSPSTAQPASVASGPSVADIEEAWALLHDTVKQASGELFQVEAVILKYST